MTIKKKVTISLIMILILSSSICFLLYKRNYNLKYKNINFKSMKVIDYIKSADEASEGKLQVNWKQMAALDAVRYKNNLSESTEESRLDLANMFLEENKGEFKVKNSNYRIISMDEVMTKLEFKEKEKERANKYLKDLEYRGLLKEELDKDSVQTDFINSIKEGAIEGYTRYGIFPSVTIAQAILESGWGKSDLTVKANNLFGIKADKGWKGEKVSMKTSEYNNQIITDNFRVYKSINDSITDHREFLYNNPRYSKAGVFQATHYIEQAQAIEKGGYSTVENHKGEKVYSDLLITLIRDYNLQLVDYEVEMKYLKGEIR